MLGFLMNSYGYGAYLRIHSNFTPLSTSYDCLSNGSYEGGIVWTSNWIRVSDLSPKGLALEAGAIYPLRRLELAAGISTIAFRQLGLDFSLGFRF